MMLRPLFLPALLGLLLGFSAQAQDLDRLLAAKLIAEANQIREAEVTVGPLQVAERKIDGSTTVTGAICVTFIAPVIQNGGRRRTIQTRTFFYDPEWGWYLFALESERGGDVIDLVSQHKGRIILR
jgi:hypothetical protein